MALTYRPLKKDGHEIRLVCIEPHHEGEREGLIRVHLEYIMISESAADSFQPLAVNMRGARGESLGNMHVL